MRRRSVELFARLGVLGAVTACSGRIADRPAFADGSLVAMAEGATLTRTLLHRPGPRGTRPAPWATTAGTTLTLAPPCSLIPGSDGPPHLYSFDLDNGDDPILVQVTPSLDGICLPRVLACLTGPNSDCAGPLDPTTLAPFQDQSTGTVPGRTIRVMFSTPQAGPPEPDRELHFRLYDPEDPGGTRTASPLEARLTTDAPLVFLRGDAANFTPAVEPIAAVYNAHVVGEFRVSYEIADRRNTRAVIATGAYAVDWSDVRPGESSRISIQAASCASAAAAGCTVASAPSAPSCVAPRARPFTLGLRIWLAPHATTRDASAVHLVARAGNGAPLSSVTLTAKSQTRPGSIDLAVDGDGAVPVTAEIDVGADTDQTVMLEAWICVPGGGGSPTAPRCAAVGPGVPASPMPDATLAVQVKAPAAAQCP